MNDSMISKAWKDYELIDSGAGAKLERFGNILLSRPSPPSVWNPALPRSEWDKADAFYQRSNTGGGDWKHRTDLPESWTISWNGLKCLLKPTGFGHLGIFPEQQPLWLLLEEHIQKKSHQMNILNLFAYTGIATAIAVRSGAKACHVDGSKGAVSWARENALRNGLGELPIRWMVDDILKFVARELKRNHKYHAIILDPPSFGRGPKGEVWKLERDLPKLLDSLHRLLAHDASLFIITCHSQNMSVPGIQNLLSAAFCNEQGQVTSGNLIIESSQNKMVLPAGLFGCWESH